MKNKLALRKYLSNSKLPLNYIVQDVSSVGGFLSKINLAVQTLMANCVGSDELYTRFMSS